MTISMYRCREFAARSSGPSVQEILDREHHPVPSALREESPRDLGYLSKEPARDMVEVPESCRVPARLHKNLALLRLPSIPGVRMRNERFTSPGVPRPIHG